MQEQEVNKIVASVMDAMTDNISFHISLEQAKALIEKVEAKAREMGVNAVIAVAFQKAYTVVALKMSTIELKQLSQPGGPLYGIQHTNQGRIVIFGGGEPLKVNGRIVGGLGVSGGSEEQDTALAAYGSQIFGM